jgi:hypothetical protein
LTLIGFAVVSQAGDDHLVMVESTRVEKGAMQSDLTAMSAGFG